MEEILDPVEPLEWRQFVLAVRRLADSLSYGTDRSPFLGAGIEFVQSRPYQWGDAVRLIDWRVTARTGRTHVKEYEAPKRLPCYFLLDTSASMAVSSQQRSKYATALQVAGGLAFACLSRVSPVGIGGLGSRDLRIEPSLSTGRVLEWLHRLRRCRYDEETQIGRRIAELAPTLANRAVVILLTDLHDPSALPALTPLGRQHECVVLLFRDPAERGVRGSGFLRAREAETARPFVTLGRRTWVQADAGAARLKRAGIDHLLIDTDRPFLHRLRHFFQSRDLLGKGTR